MYQCGDCGSGYLDTRPTPDSIGLAYEADYTHGGAEEDIFLSSGTRVGARFPAWRNGYLNRRFPRWKLSPSSSFGGRAIGSLCRVTRNFAERDARHLKAPGADSRLVDIGCGSGAFVRRAGALGYQAEGLEFDHKAVEAGVASGINVLQGGLPDTGLPDRHYEAVTVSQVIEHVHDPVAALRDVFRILKPGGSVWLATPNMKAEGHEVFGPCWRGLEPPRHRVVFSADGLRHVLRETGFTDIEFMHTGPVSEWFFSASYKISSGLKPEDPVELPGDLRARARAIDKRAERDPEASEELIVRAFKPGGRA